MFYYHKNSKYWDKQACPKGGDPDLTAAIGEVWSGLTLFAML